MTTLDNANYIRNEINAQIRFHTKRQNETTDAQLAHLHNEMVTLYKTLKAMHKATPFSTYDAHIEVKRDLGHSALERKIGQRVQALYEDHTVPVYSVIENSDGFGGIGPVRISRSKIDLTSFELRDGVYYHLSGHPLQIRRYYGSSEIITYPQ